MRIPDFLRRNARHSPDTVAYRFRDSVGWQSLTWARVLSRVESLAADLRRKHPPGSRIPLAMPNGIDWILTDLAIMDAGMVTVAIQTGLPPSILEQQLAHARVGCRPVCDADLATIVYTSGTTGSPKGVMLSHDALISNAVVTQSVLPFAEGGTVLNWLPLSHIYARNSDMLQCLVSATTLALARSPATVREDLLAVRPTNVHGVPRFYESMLRDCGGELAQAFGGRIDWIKAGGASLPASVARAYRDAGILLLQGYGMTEAAPVIASSTRTAHRPGTVGRFLPGTEYRVDPDTRELSVRSPSLFHGYWRDPQRTAEVLRDGWLSTGDRAEIADDGSVTILGRLGSTIVLSSGKKLQPEAVEALLSDIPGLEAAIVVGTGKPWPSALLWTSDPHEKPRIEAEVRSRCAGLPKWEQVRRVGWFEEAPSVAGGEWTASGKWRRENAMSRHRQRIDRLYE